MNKSLGIKPSDIKPLELSDEDMDILRKAVLATNIGTGSTYSYINGNNSTSAIVNIPAAATSWPNVSDNWTTAVKMLNTDPIIDSDVDYAIKGTMYSAAWTFSDIELALLQVTTSNDTIKEKITTHLIKELIKNNAIEFTLTKDTNSQQTTIRARLFAVPDDKVRVLRIAKKARL